MKPDLMQKVISICQNCGEETYELVGLFFHDSMILAGKEIPLIETHIDEPRSFTCRNCGESWYIEERH